MISTQAAAVYHALADDGHERADGGADLGADVADGGATAVPTARPTSAVASAVEGPDGVPTEQDPTPAPTAGPTALPSPVPTPMPACCVEHQFSATGEVESTTCNGGRSPWDASTMTEPVHGGLFGSRRGGGALPRLQAGGG